MKLTAVMMWTKWGLALCGIILVRQEFSFKTTLGIILISITLGRD